MALNQCGISIFTPTEEIFTRHNSIQSWHLVIAIKHEGHPFYYFFLYKLSEHNFIHIKKIICNLIWPTHTPSYFTRVSNRSPHHPHHHHEDLPGIRPNTYTELRKSPPKGFLTSLKIPQKRKSTLLTHSFHSTSAFHHQISKADSSPPSKQSYKERVPRRASSMLHPGVGGPWVLFGSVRRSFSGIKVYVICGRFQSILCWVISRSWKVNSVIKIRVFIATRRLQVQSVCIQGLPGGVILIVQLLVL